MNSSTKCQFFNQPDCSLGRALCKCRITQIAKASELKRSLSENQEPILSEIFSEY